MGLKFAPGKFGRRRRLVDVFGGLCAMSLMTSFDRSLLLVERTQCARDLHTKNGRARAVRHTHTMEVDALVVFKTIRIC